LPTSLDVERLAARVQSVVTIATPHHGTPIASFFTTLRGQQLLQLLSLLTIYMLHFGHLPLAGLLWMGSHGSGFDRARFEALWSDVVRFLTAGADATEVPARAARMSRHAAGAIALLHKT
jgi:hypothetical protein